MKKMNFNNLNYKTIISKLSDNAYKIHEFSKEWQIAIITIIFAKLVTNGVSIYAGYNFIYLYSLQILNSVFWSQIVAIVLLLIVEILTMVFLSKFFKFLLRTCYKTALFPFIASVVLFSISFVISTNGLAMKQSSNADNSNIITEQYETSEQQINDNYTDKINDLKLFINTIKSNPEGWSSGKRTILLKSQINKIDSLYNIIAIQQTAQKQELANLKTEQIKELQTNKILVTNEANKYFTIVAIIMILQFLFNGSLMFFYSKIYQDNNKETFIKETVTNIVGNIKENVFTFFKNEFHNTANLFINDLEIHNQEISPELSNGKNKELDSQKVAQNTTEKTSPKNKKKVVVGGFQNSNKNVFKNEIKRNQKNTQSNVITNTYDNKKNISKKELYYIKKHNIIAKNILKFTNGDKDFLSNDEVRKIQKISNGATYKSQIVVRKVYDIMLGVGFENVDNNGNIINTKNN